MKKILFKRAKDENFDVIFRNNFNLLKFKRKWRMEIYSIKVFST